MKKQIFTVLIAMAFLLAPLSAAATEIGYNGNAPLGAAWGIGTEPAQLSAETAQSPKRSDQSLLISGKGLTNARQQYLIQNANVFQKRTGGVWAYSFDLYIDEGMSRADDWVYLQLFSNANPSVQYVFLWFNGEGKIGVAPDTTKPIAGKTYTFGEWYNLRVEIDYDNGTYKTMYKKDGEEYDLVAQNTISSIDGLFLTNFTANGIQRMRAVYQSTAATTIANNVKLRIDNIAVYEAAPAVTARGFSGSPGPGRTLTAAYTTADVDLYTVKWYISDTPNGVYTEIPGASGKDLLVDASMASKYVKYGLSLNASSADGIPLYGSEVFSAAKMIYEFAPPLVENLSVAQSDYIVGDTLRGAYSVTDTSSLTLTPAYRWLISDSADGVYAPVLGYNGESALIPASWAGKFIKLEVKISRLDGAESFAALSNAVEVKPLLTYALQNAGETGVRSLTLTFNNALNTSTLRAADFSANGVPFDDYTVSGKQLTLTYKLSSPALAFAAIYTLTGAVTDIYGQTVTVTAQFTTMPPPTLQLGAPIIRDLFGQTLSNWGNKFLSVTVQAVNNGAAQSGEFVVRHYKGSTIIAEYSAQASFLAGETKTLRFGLKSNGAADESIAAAIYGTNGAEISNIVTVQ